MEKVFADGVIIKKPSEKAPEYVIEKRGYNVERFKKFLDENNKNGWVNTEVKESKKGGYYEAVDDFKPKTEEKAVEEAIDNITF